VVAYAFSPKRVIPRGLSVVTQPVSVVARLFRFTHNLAGNSFDSHANQLPAGLLVGSQLFSKTKTPFGAFIKKICCDPSGTELEPVS